MVSKAPADGYTLFMASSASLAVNPLVYSKLAYDPDRDFAPVSLIASAPLVMVVGNATPATRLKDLIPYIRSREGSFAYASNGNGNPLHLACALFGSMANVDMLHVPYNGTAPALASVLAGDTQMTCDIVLSSMPQIRAGKLRPIGIVGPRRVAALPDVPTLAEEGLLGVDAAVWFALVAPADTPAEVVARLNKEVLKAIDDAAMKARFSAMAMELGSSSPQEVVDLTNRERSKWAAVVRKHGIKVE
jgi:tripartite-type tricarboxylate transporter receptor subunit TctC